MINRDSINLYYKLIDYQYIMSQIDILNIYDDDFILEDIEEGDEEESTFDSFMESNDEINSYEILNIYDDDYLTKDKRKIAMKRIFEIQEKRNEIKKELEIMRRQREIYKKLIFKKFDKIKMVDLDHHRSIEYLENMINV